MRFLLSLSLALLIASCGDDGSPNQTFQKPGWSAVKIKNLIACEPAVSKKCKCVINKVKEEYTPEQVAQKSPFVSKRMLEIENECTNDALGGPKQEGETSLPFSYQFLGDDGCDTGTQEFPTAEAMCEGLQSRAQNADCALEHRKQHFSESCPGTFEEKE